ncbi:MAG: hypothetical protein JO182_13055 [Acidobacteriaceae bacterium]|nr:hypothetical protein [Acidobacteriaceae bacterium]MBV9938656.1 hypothetical protein [Acidobacteriaceae bacterium]
MQAVQANRIDITGAKIGSWQTAELHLPAGAAAEELKIRPVDRPAVIEVSELSLRSDAAGILWMAKTVPDLQRVRTMGTLSLLPGKDRCLFFSFGADPLWVLPALKEPSIPVSLRAVLCIYEEFEAVTNAIATAHAQIYMMAAQVRSAFADRNRTLREFQRRTEAERGIALDNLHKVQEQNAALESQCEELRQRLLHLEGVQEQNAALESQCEELRQRLLHLEGSRSWRMTRPLRSASTWAQRFRKNLDS